MPATKTKTETLITRPPVIVVMGHIDHGKSTLLDYIRKSNVTEKEVGGITQSISAYEVIHNDQKLTFLDTPGHESFGRLRGRGAEVADLAILVVSAEDGVKPQTVEAYKTLSEAKLQMIVAINKIDRPGANIERTKQSLLENEIYLEGSGGTIPTVSISAKTGEGVPELLDMLVLVTELEELKADPTLPAEGVIIEVNRDKEKGVAADLIIKSGTLKTGMTVATGESLAPVRLMENFLGKRIEEATFSSPVRVIGFDSIPQVGSAFKAFTDKKSAMEYVASMKIDKGYTAKTDIGNDEKFNLPIIIKANSSGIIDAIKYEIQKLETDQIALKVLYSAVGDVTDDDVKIASGKPDTLVIGFNAKVSAATKNLAERLGVAIHNFDIIYKLSEWLAETAKEKTPRVEVEEKKGTAKVLKLFSQDKDRQVIGGRVEEGMISLGDEVRIIRRDSLISHGKVKELQQMKNKVKDVSEGSEFGAMVESKIEVAPGDKLEVYIMVQK